VSVQPRTCAVDFSFDISSHIALTLHGVARIPSVQREDIGASVGSFLTPKFKSVNKCSTIFRPPFSRGAQTSSRISNMHKLAAPRTGIMSNRYTPKLHHIHRQAREARLRAFKVTIVVGRPIYSNMHDEVAYHLMHISAPGRITCINVPCTCSRGAATCLLRVETRCEHVWGALCVQPTFAH